MTQVAEEKPNYELETWCGLSYKAIRDAASENGIKLNLPIEYESRDIPERIWSQLRNFRRVMARSKGEPKRLVLSMHRQLVSERDEKGKSVKKEYLTWNGYYEVFDYGGAPYHANLEVGKYQRPKVAANSSRKYDQDTGEPIGPAKIFNGSEDVYTITVPQSKTERKKLIDSIIGDNFAEDINYYFDNESEPLGRSDSTFTYDEFVSDSIEDLRKKSFQGGGSLTPGIWRDKDGVLRDKFGQKLTPENGNKEAYQ